MKPRMLSRSSFPRKLPCLSFPRRRESRPLIFRINGERRDSRLCGNDGVGMRMLLAALLWLAALPAFAQASQQADAAPLQFRDATEEARFHALASQLRCVMCQNQSLADSNALIALRLRHEVLDLMREGRSDAQIKDFLVQRYGEFVLYKPRFEGSTWLLWAGPALVLLAGAGAVVAVVRRRRPASPVAPDDGQEW